jgi:hypothetical protein
MTPKNKRVCMSVLDHQYVFNSHVRSKEGARVGTSIGRFADRCN